MTSGWVCFYRKVWDNPRSSDPEWISVWLYLLSFATHQERSVLFNGRRITLLPGQLITGRQKIAANTGIHESKVHRLLKIMEIEQQIEQQTCNANRLITIVNWKSYQYVGRDTTNNQRTTSEQPANINKKLKTEKTENTPPNPQGGLVSGPAFELYSKLVETGKFPRLTVETVAELARSFPKADLTRAMERIPRDASELPACAVQAPRQWLKARFSELEVETVASGDGELEKKRNAARLLRLER